MGLDDRGRVPGQPLGDDPGHFGRTAGDGHPVNRNNAAEMVMAKRVDRNERGRPVGFVRVVQRNDGNLLGMGVNGGGDALQSQDTGVDIGLRGGLVVAKIGLDGREEANMTGL